LTSKVAFQGQTLDTGFSHTQKVPAITGFALFLPNQSVDAFVVQNFPSPTVVLELEMHGPTNTYKGLFQLFEYTEVG